MAYAKLAGGEIVKYPYTAKDLRSDYPNTSFPEIVTEYMLREYDVHLVNPTPKPVNYRKNYTLGTPVFIANELFESWDEQDASQAEIDQRISDQWILVRSDRDSRLKSSDWTQLEDVPLSNESKLEWSEYRQYLRDITEQLDPFEIWWPEEPTNV